MTNSTGRLSRDPDGFVLQIYVLFFMLISNWQREFASAQHLHYLFVISFISNDLSQVIQSW